MRIALVILPLAVLALGPAMAAGKRLPAADKHNRFCISDFNLGNPRPLADGRLLFPARPAAGQSYAATFKGGRCPGLHEFSTVIIERDGGQFCEGDKVRGVDPPQTIPGPICIIDHFDPYAEPPRAGR